MNQVTTAVQKAINDAAAWGAVYGEAIPVDQWDEIRDTKAQNMVEDLRPLLEPKPEAAPQRIGVPKTMLADGMGVLDPLTAYIEDHGQGRGMLTIVCFGRAWSAYWGAMGPNTVRQFLLQNDAGYIAGCLVRGTIGLIQKNSAMRREEEYVERIAKALLDQLAAEAGL